MNTNNPNRLMPGPDCAPYVSLLPLLDTGILGTQEDVRVKAHVATCRWCAAQRAAYITVDAAVRRYVNTLVEATPSGTAEEISRIADKDAPSAPTQLISRRVTPLRKPRQRLLGLTAIAAVLLIAVLAQAIFSWRAGPPSGSTPPMAAPPSVYLVANHTLYALGARDGVVRWQTPASSVVTTDPIVANGIVYTAGYPNALVGAQRTRDGTVLWKKLIVHSEGKRIALEGDILYLTTDAIGGQVTYPGYAHGVYAVRASDGITQWRYVASEPVISPPLVVGGVVYAGVGTSLVAVRVSDGALLWRRPLAANGHAYLGLWLSSAAGVVYVYGSEQNLEQPYAPTPPSGNDANIFALRNGDGSLLWSKQLAGADDYQVNSTPIIADGVIYVHSNGFGSQALAEGRDRGGANFFAMKASDGALLWEQQGANSQPAVEDGVVYFGDTLGFVRALRAEDGTLLWKQQVTTSALRSERITLSAADHTLFIGISASQDPRPAAVQARRTNNGSLLWEHQIAGAFFGEIGTPIFAS